jgi:putative FmdB family regulatory protein
MPTVVEHAPGEETGMPLYEYACAECQARHEVRQPWDATPLATCPQCGGPLRRIYSLSAIIFKGPGFYSTDYRSS